MRHYQITHATHYDYSMSVVLSRQVAHLRPAHGGRQHTSSHILHITPKPTEQISRTDYFGNDQHHFQIEERHTELSIVAESRVTVESPDPVDPQIGPTCRDVREWISAPATREDFQACQMAAQTPQTGTRDSVFAFASAHLLPDRPYLEAALALNTAIYEQFEFDNEATDITTPVDEVLRLRRGVCQDFAHLMLACLRSHRLPARYVSGYILTNPPPGKPRLQGADASHAWVSVCIPGSGWIDLDPTNNLICDDEHITVAIGRDYSDVSPLRGAVTGGGAQEISIEVTVTPEEERTG